MNIWYDRNGTPITVESALALFSGDNRRVAETTIGRYWVSTVHLVIDHGHGQTERPVIFETMVFKDGTATDEYMERYCTEDEAKAGHENIVGMVRALESVPS